MSENTKCPICKNGLTIAGPSLIYRACVTPGCVMFGRDRPYTEFERIGNAIESARRATREEAAQLVANKGHHDLADEIRKMPIISEK